MLGDFEYAMKAEDDGSNVRIVSNNIQCELNNSDKQTKGNTRIHGY